MQKKSSKGIIITSSILGITFMALLGYMARERFLPGLNDFVQLYVGATLVGEPGLYSPDVNRDMQIAIVGHHLESVYYSRIPAYAFVLKPLAALPYQTAYIIFQALSLIALAVFLRLGVRRAPETALMASLSIPLLANLLAGQDLAFVLCFALCSLTAAARGKDFLAGLLLIPCLIKPHLFLLAPVAMLMYRRWRFFAGGVTGTALALLVSFVAAGPRWISEYLGLLRNPVLHPGSDHMPNLHSLATVISDSPALEAVFMALAVATCAYVAHVVRDFELAFAFCVAAGLLISFHAYVQDAAVLLLVFAVVVSRSDVPVVRGLMVLLVAPPLYLLLFAGHPYSTAVPVAILGTLVAAAIAYKWRTAREAAPAAPVSAGA